MGRMYSATFQNVAVTAQQDFFEITPADDEPVTIHAVFLTQGSDVGDAAEEMLRVAILRGHTTSGSGGTAASEVALDPKEGAASAAVELNNTTIASVTTPDVMHEEQFNIRSGLPYIPTPEIRPKADQGNTTIVVRLLTTPADSLSMSGTIYWEEG